MFTENRIIRFKSGMTYFGEYDPTKKLIEIVEELQEHEDLILMYESILLGVYNDA